MKPIRPSLTLALLEAREAIMSHFRSALNEVGLTEQQWRIIRILYQYEEQLKFNDLILQKKHDFKNLINGLENLKTSIMSKDEAKMLTKINELIDYCKELSE